jgi:hypothetical protein
VGCDGAGSDCDRGSRCGGGYGGVAGLAGNFGFCGAGWGGRKGGNAGDDRGGVDWSGGAGGVGVGSSRGLDCYGLVNRLADALPEEVQRLALREVAVELKQRLKAALVALIEPEEAKPLLGL